MNHQLPTTNNFLGLPDELSARDKAEVVLLPLPYEATVTYGRGAAAGPAAIISASRQVEFYDREFDGEPVREFGIHTMPALALPDDPALATAKIARAVAPHAEAGKFVVGLGGEHTVSVGLVRGLLEAGKGPLTIVQIDAHSDLRDTYDNNPYSHACVARRLLDERGVDQVLQLGVRSVSREEVAFARAHPGRIGVWYAEDVHSGTWQEAFENRAKGRRVYLTIDVDGLDPGVVMATGTPEPDGLSWAEALDIIRTLTRIADVVGFDCVELAPAPGMHASEYAAAKLVYKTMCLIMSGGLT